MVSHTELFFFEVLVPRGPDKALLNYSNYSTGGLLLYRSATYSMSYTEGTVCHYIRHTNMIIYVALR